MEERDRSLLGRYRADLRGVIGSSASAYGYTLTVWSSGSMLTHFHGSPGPAQVFAFFGGAIVAFALVGALAYGGVTARFEGGSGRVELWGSFHFLSVGLAVGVASLVAAYVPGFWAGRWRFLDDDRIPGCGRGREHRRGSGVGFLKRWGLR